MVKMWRRTHSQKCRVGKVNGSKLNRNLVWKKRLVAGGTGDCSKPLLAAPLNLHTRDHTTRRWPNLVRTTQPRHWQNHRH